MRSWRYIPSEVLIHYKKKNKVSLIVWLNKKIGNSKRLKKTTKIHKSRAPNNCFFLHLAPDTESIQIKITGLSSLHYCMKFQIKIHCFIVCTFSTQHTRNIKYRWRIWRSYKLSSFFLQSRENICKLDDIHKTQTLIIDSKNMRT